VLGDTMGELLAFYAAADIAFVGGSLVEVGGHNLLEPAALCLPMVIGPHNYNAQDITDLFVDSGVARIVQDADELAAAVLVLLHDSAAARRLGDQAGELTETSRGALHRLLALLEPLLR
jgi:3-deoxy-D-manno-octulosonic-acid transferase